MMSTTLRDMQIRIVVAGYGPVGRALYEVLNRDLNHDMYIDDPYKFNELEISEKEWPHAVVVAVATPKGPDGKCDTSNVNDVFEKYGKAPKYLVKSAVDPVYLSKMGEEGYNITYSPEFLKGSTSGDPTADFLNSELAIYGGGSMRWWHEKLKPYFTDLKVVRYTSLEQAAFAKYVENSFLATKVTFFNEMYQIYNALGFKDFDIMVEAICNDSRIGHSHTQVPGPDGKFGYGGHCLPKDVAAIANLGKEYGAPTYLLEAIQSANEVYRNENSVGES